MAKTEKGRRNAVTVSRHQPILNIQAMKCVCVFYPAPSEGWEPSISK